MLNRPLDDVHISGSFNWRPVAPTPSMVACDNERCGALLLSALIALSRLKDMY